PAPCQRVTLSPYATPITHEICQTGVGKPDDQGHRAMETLSTWRVVQVTCQASYQVAMVEYMRPHRWLLRLTDPSRAKILLLVEARRMDQLGTRYEEVCTGRLDLRYATGRQGRAVRAASPAGLAQPVRGQQRKY